jgi:16S rRNA processing protein RimM
VRIESRAGTAQKPVIGVAGVEDRGRVEDLRGEAITVERDAIGDLDSDEHLVDDLIGMRVVDGARTVGIVRDVSSLPSVDVLEVERSDAEILLVPMVANAIRCLDAPHRLIDVDMRFLGED